GCVGELCGGPRTRLAAHDDYLVRADGGRDIAPPRADRQVFRIDQGRQGALDPRTLLGFTASGLRTAFVCVFRQTNRLLHKTSLEQAVPYYNFGWTQPLTEVLNHAMTSIDTDTTLSAQDAPEFAPAQFVRWFREVAPYVHDFRGKTFVVAFGGELVSDGALNTLIQDLSLL